MTWPGWLASAALGFKSWNCYPRAGEELISQEASPHPFPRYRRQWRLAFVCAALLAFAGLAYSLESQAPPHLTLATTTDVRDTGLIDYLDAAFTSATGIDVRYTAVGTGQALDLARRGDADALLVHAPSSEIAFMNQGQGLCRSLLMRNQFLLVGPPSDPAHVAGLTNITQAFRVIMQSHSIFVSRGDQSGTNVKELQIWALVGYTPSPANDTWYLETGQGMAATLQVASEKGGYTLTDDATFYALKASSTPPDLQIEVQGDPVLANIYHVIVVNPQAHAGLNTNGALEYARWLTSPQGQSLIGSYEVGGHRLYTPQYAPGDPEGC